VSLNKDVLIKIVTEAINKVSDRENVIIKVSRDDVEHVKKYKDRISGIVDGVKNLSIVEDSQVEPGGCVIETNLGFVDARVSTKLSLIEQSLKKAQASVTEQ
jgi:flagellar assembly protein FliH